MATTWHLIIQLPRGRTVRETEDSSPDTNTLDYWEKFYKSHSDDAGYTSATVINIFTTGDE
jgi:hypothetical protein